MRYPIVHNFPSRRCLPCLFLSVAGLLLGSVRPVSAQQTPPLATTAAPNTGIALSGLSALPLASASSDPMGQTDVIFGRNTTGPYLLSWKGLRDGSESVVRDGTPLHRTDDYTLDAAAGTLAFTAPLLPDQIVRVTYRIDTPTAQRNTSAIVMPLQADLWRTGQNHLSFGMLYRSDPGNPNAAPTALNTLQFQGSTHFLPSSQVSSGLFLNLDGGDWLGRSGLSLGEQTHFKSADFGVSYSRAGALFAQPDASGLQAGNQILQATGKLSPLQGLSLQAGFRQTTQLLAPTDTSPDPVGATTTELSRSLELALPKNGGKLQAGQTDTVVASPDGSGQTSAQNTVQLERALTKNTQATLGYQSVTTTPTGSDATGATYDQKASVSLTSRPSALVSLSGTYQNELGTAGPQDTLGWHVDSTPFARWKALKVTLNWNDTFRSDGTQRSREALMQLPPLGFANAKLSGGVRQTSAPGQDQLVGILDASLRPIRYVEVSGGVRLRDGTLAGSAPDPNASDTYNIKVAFAPWKQFQVTGSAARNPENSDGTFQRTQTQAFGVQTQLGSLQLKGQYGIQEAYQAMQTQNTLDLTLGLRLTSHDTLTTGYQGQFAFDNGLSGSRAYSLNFTHRIGSAVDLSLGGTMTLYDTNGATQWDQTDLKANAQLNLRF